MLEWFCIHAWLFLQAWVTFYPTREQQTNCCGEEGLKGDLIIFYDVKRQKPSGELQVLSPQNIDMVKVNNWHKGVSFSLIFVFPDIKWLFCPLLCTHWSDAHTKKCGVCHRPEWLDARHKNGTGKLPKGPVLIQYLTHYWSALLSSGHHYNTLVWTRIRLYELVCNWTILLIYMATIEETKG